MELLLSLMAVTLALRTVTWHTALLSSTVAVMVAVPGDRAVTTPSSTVATAASLVLHSTASWAREAGAFGEDWLHLGAGGCRLCPVCAKRTNEPCRHPQDAMASLETYGVAVSELAASCGMKYINGQNTVTYFGAVLFQDAE